MVTHEFVLALDAEPVTHVVRVDRVKYDMVHDSILANLGIYGPMASTQLGAAVEQQLHEDFDGPLMWYYSMVSSDMLACGQIRPVPGSRPETIEISI